MRREKSNYIIQSVAHALDVLEQFFGDADELGVTELSKRLKLHKNNVFRLLALRVGYLTAPFADVEGWSYGGGVTLPVGPWGSVGYQFASVPTMDDFDRPLRQGWTVWLDPTRFFVKG